MIPTSLPSASCMHMFIIIIWQSSQMWTITKALDRHTQLKTMLALCCVADSNQQNRTIMLILSNWVNKILFNSHWTLLQSESIHLMSYIFCDKKFRNPPRQSPNPEVELRKENIHGYTKQWSLNVTVSTLSLLLSLNIAYVFSFAIKHHAKNNHKHVRFSVGDLGGLYNRCNYYY